MVILITIPFYLQLKWKAAVSTKLIKIDFTLALLALSELELREILSVLNLLERGKFSSNL